MDFSLANISIQQILVFLQVAEQGGFAKASAYLNMTQSAVSHQLRILKQSRVIKNRREGKSVFYSLADEHVRTIIAQGREHVLE